MVSKTQIKQRKRRKKNLELVETIQLALKNEGWGKVAAVISGSRQNYSIVNLEEIEAKTKEGDTVVIPGKVLSQGNLTKKVRVCAISFSKNAEEKIKKNKGEVVGLLEEIKKNPKAEGIKLIR